MKTAGCIIIAVALLLAAVKALIITWLIGLILPLPITLFNVFIVWVICVVASISFKANVQ
jgi:hypothetical protein